jgi:hypothetical protein
MKEWNGYQVATLHKRKWTVIRVIRDSDDPRWRQLFDWLKQDHSGQYYVDRTSRYHLSLWDWDFYFEDSTTAFEFALRA